MSVRFLASLALIAALGGCASYRAPDPAFHAGLNAPYKFDAGDRLRVAVLDQPNISGTYLVNQGGMIVLPLAGTVSARGKTAPQLQKAIVARLSETLVKPDVAVDIDTYRPFFVMGEVKAAGQYPYVPGLTVQSAIAVAGGYSARAQMADADVTRQLDGSIATATVPVTDPIRPGDTIYVRERFF